MELKMTREYDSEKKVLHSKVTRSKEDVESTYLDTFNENAIKKLVRDLDTEKKQLKNAIIKNQETIDNSKFQLENMKKVKLTKEQKKLKENITALQEWDQVNQIHKKIENAQLSIKHLREQKTEKNDILKDIKSKVKNIDFYAKTNTEPKEST